MARRHEQLAPTVMLLKFQSENKLILWKEEKSSPASSATIYRTNPTIATYFLFFFTFFVK